MTALARRYARAAVSAAAEQGGTPALDHLLKDLQAFVDAVAASGELRGAIANPALRAERPKVLAAVVTSLRMATPSVRLLELLARNDRLEFIDEVLREATEVIDARIGRGRARVRSATALTEAQRQRIAKALETRFGHPVTVVVDVDPTIIGGLLCEVGDVTLDGSVRRQLELVRERLLG